MPSPLLICIIGPTGTGKSALAVRLAQLYGTAVLSADARQVYRGMDIGTGKITTAEMQGVPHYGLDLAAPGQRFTTLQYLDYALPVLAQLHRQHRVVVVAGGTGLYVQALLHGLDDIPDTPAEVRAAVSADLAAQGLPALLDELLAADPATWARIDRHNPRRVQRALEVYRATGRPISSWQTGQAAPRPWRSLVVGLWDSMEAAEARIAVRVRGMIDAGLENETRALLAAGCPADAQCLQTIGYRETLDYLAGGLTEEQWYRAIVTSTRQYAKRQMTWFRKYGQAQWYSPASTADILARASTFVDRM